MEFLAGGARPPSEGSGGGSRGREAAHYRNAIGKPF
jgi:hypothetical protein